MTYAITVRHVDTCLSCYVLDHCNGETETLIGVPVHRSSRVHTVKADLVQEATWADEVFPGDMASEQIRAAINAAFAGAHPFKAWDADLDPYSDNTETVYSWFRFSWEKIESDLA